MIINYLDYRIQRCHEAPTDESYSNFIRSCNELEDLVVRIHNRPANNRPLLFTPLMNEFYMLVDVLRRFISATKLHRNEENLLGFVQYCFVKYAVFRSFTISANEPLVNRFGQEYLAQLYHDCIELMVIAHSITLGERGPPVRPLNHGPIGNDQDLLKFHMIQNIINKLEDLGNTGNLTDEFYLIDSLIMILRAINECFEDFYNEYYMEYPVRDDGPIIHIIPNPDDL